MFGLAQNCEFRRNLKAPFRSGRDDRTSSSMRDEWCVHAQFRCDIFKGVIRKGSSRRKRDSMKVKAEGAIQTALVHNLQ